MKRLAAGFVLVLLFAAGCGSDESPRSVPLNDGAAGTCLAGDPNCADGADAGAAGGLPDAVSVGSDEGPLELSFGGFFYSDGNRSQLCSSLAESFPPQCGSLVIDLSAPLDVVLDHVAESFGNPDDAKINIDQGIYWTDDWINLSGTLENNRLVLG